MWSKNSGVPIFPQCLKLNISMNSFFKVKFPFFEVWLIEDTLLLTLASSNTNVNKRLLFGTDISLQKRLLGQKSKLQFDFENAESHFRFWHSTSSFDKTVLWFVGVFALDKPYKHFLIVGNPDF